MPRRLVPVGVALALLAALAGAIIAACYDIPRPACGYICGPEAECPDGYRCATDHYCHRDGTPDSLVCRTPDAGLPPDAAPDVMADAGADAAPDAGPDAAPDAALDASPDAPDAADADAEIDAPDAPP